MSLTEIFILVNGGSLRIKLGQVVPYVSQTLALLVVMYILMKTHVMKMENHVPIHVMLVEKIVVLTIFVVATPRICVAHTLNVARTLLYSVMQLEIYWTLDLVMMTLRVFVADSLDVVRT